MKDLKFVGTVALAVGILALVGCSAKTNSSQTKPQTATVQRGSIVVSTTSAGNLAFTRTQDVAFQMAGTVQDVNVSVGDSVKHGEVLATLDTTAFDSQIQSLQNAVTTAQRNLATAERNILSQQMGVTQAQLNLQAAQNTVATIPEVKSAQDLVDNAQAALTAAKGFSAIDASGGVQIVAIQQQLAQAQQNLKSVLSGTSFNLSSDVSLQIAKAQFAVQQTQFALDSANVSVQNAIQDRDTAKQALANAQSNLSDAQGVSPAVTAPFDGFVTAVDVQGGEDIKKGAIAVTVADPTQFQVQVPVGERDALSLQVGGAATVSVNAMTGVTLPGRITAVAPTATVQSGVVNYQITVQVTSFVPVSGGLSTGQRGTNGGSGSGNFTGQGQRPQFTGTPGAGTGQTPRFTGTPGQGQAGQLPNGGTAPTAAAQAVTLRQGLSVTVTLVTSQANNVLMVPNRAIVRQQGKTYVNVEKGGTSSEAAVTTGISNTSFTAVTSGLNEGDTVVIPAATVSPTTIPRTGGGGGIRIPGIGG